jgi:uncharacterized LabA/DUF88 family protein
LFLRAIVLPDKSVNEGAEPQIDRLMIFIDGQNLFYGCNAYQKGFPWDYDKFIRVLTNLAPNRKLIQVYYHSSIAPVDRNRVGDDVRYRKQQMFYNVLRQKCKTEIKETKVQSIPCPNCSTTFKRPKEKGVDVALAADLLLYGMTGDYDVAILVSGDSDYIPVLKKLAERKPNLKIEVAQFRGQVGYELRDLGFPFHPLDLIAEQFRRITVQG